MIVRREATGDREAVFAVHSAAFDRGGREDGESGQAPPEPTLVEDLRRAGDLIPQLSLVATIDGEVVGHVACSRAYIALDASRGSGGGGGPRGGGRARREGGGSGARGGSRPSVGLGPLGVLPSHQGGGIGQALMHAVLAAADALDAPEVVLLGSPSYYGRFGFRPAEELGVLPPDPSWGGHFQIRALTAWDGTIAGVFGYAPAFRLVSARA
ncbi:MAG: GNAT family N-acetyltransferase [Acidimicrobiales bacterium]